MALPCPSYQIVLPTRSRALVLILPLALACSLDEVSPLPVEPRPPERAIYSVAECTVAFSPDEALRLDVEEAAVRWALATGCDLFVGEGGVPVSLVPSIERPDGTQAPGVTSRERDRIGINEQASAQRRTSSVLHEMGHALGGDHTETDGVLWGQKGRRDVIDAAALETVCSRLPCPAFRPEER